MLDKQAAEKTAERGDDNKYQETPIPPSIKDITRHEDKQILPPQLLEDEPVEQEHYRQEDHECERVKKHIAQPLVREGMLERHTLFLVKISLGKGHP